MDEITKYTIQQEIQTTLGTYEPRVALNGIDIKEDNINQGYFINIFYTIINSYTVQSVAVFLERVR